MQELEEVLVTPVELKQLLRVYTGKRSLVAQTRLLVLSPSLSQPDQCLQTQTHQFYEKLVNDTVMQIIVDETNRFVTNVCVPVGRTCSTCMS